MNLIANRIFDKRLALLTALALGLTTAACGGDGDGGDGGAGGSGGGNGGGETAGFHINAGLGITVRDRTFAGEGKASGFITVVRGDEALEGATVTLNGTVVPESQLAPSLYDPEGIEEIDAGPGIDLVIEATHGSDHASVTLPCPGGFEITSPVENATFRPGDTVEVRWSGDIHHDSSILYGPSVVLRRYSSEQNRLHPGVAQGEEWVAIEPGMTRATVVAPDLFDEYDGWVLELRVPGAFVVDGDNAGICFSARRIVLLGQD